MILSVYRRLKLILQRFLVLLGSLTLFIFLFCFIFLLNSNESQKISLGEHDNVLLTLNLSGEIAETANDKNPFSILFSGYTGGTQGLYIPDIEKNLKKVANDARVKGILVNVNNLVGSFSQYDELRKVFDDFKTTSKKSLYFWLGAADTKTYYLSSVGTQVVLSPLGSLIIPGPLSQLTYLGSFLKKIGVGFDVIKVGDYKSAVEPLIQDSPSNFASDNYTTLNKTVLDYIVNQIMKSRPFLQKDSLKKAFKDSILNSNDAKNLRLIDDIVYEKSFKHNLLSIHEAKSVSFEQYFSHFKSKESVLPSNGDGIALIEAEGNIYFESSSYGAMITYTNLSKEIAWVKNEDKVKAVVFRISSPGGDANAADNIWHDINELAKVKPLIVSMGGYAASGGYYIASPAKKIFALPTTLTGSIGVFGVIPNLSKFKEKYGINFHAITESNRKSLFNPGEELTESDVRIIKKSMLFVYDEFLRKVSLGRNIEIKDLLPLAGGKVWTGIQAQKIGLVDNLGGISDAIYEAEKIAGFHPFPGEEVSVPLYRWKPKITSLIDCFKNSQNLRSCFSSGQQEVMKVFSNKNPDDLLKNRIIKSVEQFMLNPIQMLFFEIK